MRFATVALLSTLTFFALPTKEAQASPGGCRSYSRSYSYSPRASIRIGSPRFSFGITFGGSHHRHVHRFAVSVRRSWVEPVYEDRIAGYDSCGNPYYRRVLVRAGYWQSLRHRACSCGASYP